MLVGLALAAITLLLDVETGRVVEATHTAEAETRLVTPGSTIKPFTLLALKEQGKLGDGLVACSGRLMLAGRRFDCSHPHIAAPLDADMALAYSCNTWFAVMAKRLDRGRFKALLQRYGFWVTSGELQLAALGESGVTTTPLALAKAYRRIAKEGPIPGLRGAVEFGTAQLAAVPGLSVAGKTGTTASPGRMSTSAWFAGYAPAEKPKVVVVVFVEEGKGGATAAPVAAEVLRKWAGRE
ncbi:MAG: hypothetical protein IT168_19505 [Bryobacterales bacterium]|nr:hypothetical protein [Bryobacterales bacterium]